MLYNGSNGESYREEVLGGVCAPPAQFMVIDLPANGIQNGSPDGIALVDASDNVLEFISYEGSLTAINGPAVGLTSVDIGVSESSSAAVGTSLQRTGSGCEGMDFTWAGGDISETKMTINAGQYISCVSIIFCMSVF